jgi:hypothetical protein
MQQAVEDRERWHEDQLHKKLGQRGQEGEAQLQLAGREAEASLESAVREQREVHEQKLQEALDTARTAMEEDLFLKSKACEKEVEIIQREREMDALRLDDALDAMRRAETEQVQAQRSLEQAQQLQHSAEVLDQHAVQCSLSTRSSSASLLLEYCVDSHETILIVVLVTCHLSLVVDHRRLR